MQRTKAELDAMSADDFAGPDRSFPIETQDDVDAAAKLYGKAADPDTVKAKIVSIAKRKDLKVPDAWSVNDDRAKEFSDVERPARLFVAGHYPKKGVTITTEDLQTIATNSNAGPGVELRFHHEPGFSTGRGHSFYVKGNELWGTLSVDASGLDVIEKNGTKGLSLGILPNLAGLDHIALTPYAHVKSAQLFSNNRSDVVVFSLDDDFPEEVDTPMTAEEKAQAEADAKRLADLEKKVLAFSEQTEARDAEIKAAREEAAAAKMQAALLRGEANEAKAQAQVMQFSDKIPPTGQKLAVALLQAPAVINFAGEDKPTSVLFAEFLATLPAAFAPALKFKSGSNPTGEVYQFSDEEKELARKQGYTAEEMAKIQANMTAAI